MLFIVGVSSPLHGFSCTSLKADAHRCMTALEYGAHGDRKRLAAGIALVEAGAPSLALELRDPMDTAAVPADLPIVQGSLMLSSCCA